MMKKTINILLLTLALPLLSGCFGVFLGAAATGGVVAGQETTLGTELDDTAIYWKIKSLYLDRNPQDLLAGVNVKVIEGRVTLTGKVQIADSRVDAVKLAWQPNGVKEVINEIQIEETASLKEIAKSKWIKAQVLGKITAEKDVRSLNYTVEVVSGVVYLMGIAQDIDELNTVTNLASTVKGVVKVVSHVRVKNDPGREG
jgi:hypothetical protein